ncbi:MAG TPA: methionine--tRNA ligase [Nitrososphaera sp.]|nr:methionine--tRNA ligase [Nitrososphaera sp.]
MSEQGQIITFDEFIKVQLKVGKVVSAEAISGMKKVFKAVVDIGTEKREVAVGAALWIKPEDFVGRTVVICTNLAPRKIGDMTSNGMLLAADGPEGRPAFLTIAEEGEVPLGARIH